MADQLADHGRLMRSLLYGKDKTKKTWWACRAAEEGYNVCLLDGDDGATIVKQLPEAARKRILVVNLADTDKLAVFCRFMATFTKGKLFLWDEHAKVTVPTGIARNPEHSYILFDPEKFTGNDVIVLDSWTALAMSTMKQFASETDTDLTQIERDGDNFALPNFQARYLDHVLNSIKTWKGHAIVIGHETNYEKYKGKGRDRKIVGDYIQPISSTGPQGQKLGKFFENVLRFSRLSDISYQIDAGGDDSHAGGSRLLPPKKYNWNDVTPQLLMGALGAKPIGDLCHGAIFIPKGGEFPDLAKSNTTNTQAAKIASEIPATVVPAQPQVLNAGSLSLAERIKLKKTQPVT
jgi:hypothetical protein